MTDFDQRISIVQSLINSKKYDEACTSMSEEIERDPENHEVWFMYAGALNEAGKFDAAIDAALQSWLLSGQENEYAVKMAVDLLPIASPVSTSTSDNSHQIFEAVRLLRAEISKELGLIQ